MLLGIGQLLMGNVSQVVEPALLVNPLRKLRLVSGNAGCLLGGTEGAVLKWHLSGWDWALKYREHEELEVGILR